MRHPLSSTGATYLQRVFKEMEAMQREGSQEFEYVEKEVNTKRERLRTQVCASLDWQNSGYKSR